MPAISITHLIIGAAAFAVIVAVVIAGRGRSNNSTSRIDINFDSMKDEEIKRRH
ncbi:hypothetical protein [Desulfovibrio oxyclinae]|uniref:hypothetical protein n=1 Tax=Desulfovibrio oxyclinae TaxID=63560 RepID=UPI00036CDF23|nr:hypothetical protein [Desulfovibrio oxyclinae]